MHIILPSPLCVVVVILCKVQYANRSAYGGRGCYVTPNIAVLLEVCTCGHTVHSSCLHFIILYWVPLSFSNISRVTNVHLRPITLLKCSSDKVFKALFNKLLCGSCEAEVVLR